MPSSDPGRCLASTRWVRAPLHIQPRRPFCKLYVPTTCALAAVDGHSVESSFDDPLFGENSVSAMGRKHQRSVETGTLDASLAHYHLKAVDLLKVDIEAHGAEALKGADGTLRKTRFVMFETDSRTEMSEASTPARCRIRYRRHTGSDARLRASSSGCVARSICSGEAFSI